MFSKGGVKVDVVLTVYCTLLTAYMHERVCIFLQVMSIALSQRLAEWQLTTINTADAVQDTVLEIKESLLQVAS